ncbi:MAG: hypothetical protein ACTHU0_10040 [Kofleriaceae bacterium]
MDLGDAPEGVGLCNPGGGIEYFESEVWPSFVRPGNPMGCTRAGGCHDLGGGNALSFTTNPVDFAANYRQTQVYLNCGTPNASQFLTKPLAGIEAHGGMDIFQPSDPAVAVFLGWFE